MAYNALQVENTALPLLRKQYTQVQKSIDNLLNAMEQGIITPSTKERLEALEQQKNELSVQIIKEEAARPTITKEEILFWFHRFRKLDTDKIEHRRRLIDSFINAIYLYDDKIAFIFNYKDGAETITFDELNDSALSSDLSAFGGPTEESRKHQCFLDFFFLPVLLLFFFKRTMYE